MDRTSGQQNEAVNRGFSKQSVCYDESDRVNIILQDLRQQVYDHVAHFLSGASKILELNCGTGIDAVKLASDGHYVHATDVSDGMIGQTKAKISRNDYEGRLTCQQLSYERLDLLGRRDFDYVFSNFGGLNCIPDLRKVAHHLPPLLKPGAYVTWVVMPPICPWELLWILKGKPGMAARRLRRGGTVARLEGEAFNTYYHSLSAVRAAMPANFRFIRSEGLAALSPPPHSSALAEKNPNLYGWLRRLDKLMRSHFPFNRWADHIIVTFRYLPS